MARVCEALLKNYRSSTWLSIFFSFWWLFDWFDCFFNLDVETAHGLKIDLLLLVTSMTYSGMRRWCRECVGDMKSLVLLCPNPLEEQRDLKTLNQAVFIRNRLNIFHHLLLSIYTHWGATTPVVFVITFAWFSCDNTVWSYIYETVQAVRSGNRD